VAYESRRHQKLTRCEVHVAEPATPSFLQWLESAITFDRCDHPSSIPQLGRCLLVIDPIAIPRRHAEEAGDTTWADQHARNIRGSNQLQDGDPHLRGGRISWILPCHLGAVVLREGNGYPQLHVPQAQDAGPTRGYHHRLLFPACLPVRGGELRARLGGHRLRGARSHSG
jgi:hypothetical protein